MKKWAIIATLLTVGTPALAQDALSMAREEREAYLEACLIVTQTDPAIVGSMQLGTGAVTRGHASVAFFDKTKKLSAQLSCSFATFTQDSGPSPTAEKLTVTYADGSTLDLDVAAANAVTAEQMK